MTLSNGEIGPLPKQHDRRRLRNLGLIAALLGPAMTALFWIGTLGARPASSTPMPPQIPVTGSAVTVTPATGPAQAVTPPTGPAQAVTPPTEPTEAHPIATEIKPQTVSLHVQGPGGAAVVVDGKKVGVVPADLTLPSRPGQREVTVRANGFLPWTQRLPADEERTVKATPRRRLRQTARTDDPEAELVNPFRH